MGAGKKLSGEIHRVNKDVQAAISDFNTASNKVYNTEKQKLKYEEEMKKQVKKLNHYRDLIGNLLNSAEIRNKKVSVDYQLALENSRQLIGKVLGSFHNRKKQPGRNAVSKEDVEQQPNMDPKEKAKSETREWVNNTVSKLRAQIDSFEAEEGLSVKKGTKPHRLIHLESSISRHEKHMEHLEQISTLLNNDAFSPEQASYVKDFVDYYVEKNQF